MSAAFTLSLAAADAARVCVNFAAAYSGTPPVAVASLEARGRDVAGPGESELAAGRFDVCVDTLMTVRAMEEVAVWAAPKLADVWAGDTAAVNLVKHFACVAGGGGHACSASTCMRA